MRKKAIGMVIKLSVIGLFLFLLGKVAPAEFMGHFTVFVLAVFVGWQVIWNVTHALHTPLMSGCNAISGIAIVGAILATVTGGGIGTWLGLIAVIFATINVVGGFMVTDRMLKMFKNK